MIKRKLWIVLMCVVVLAFTGCNDKNKVDKKDTEVSGDVSENESVLENETVIEKEETQKKHDTTTNTETNKNNTTTNKNETTSNKNETTTKPSTGSNNATTKPSAGSTGNTGSTNNSGSTDNSGSAGITGNTQNNNTSTTPQPSTPVHEHKWTEVTEDEIHYYAWRTICNVCNTDITDMSVDESTYHVAVICGGSYAAYYKEVDFVTENVVKTPVVTGYKCECGEVKGK